MMLFSPLGVLIATVMLCLAGGSAAETIERPASQLINPAGSVRDIARSEISKSKIVPIMRPKGDSFNAQKSSAPISRSSAVTKEFKINAKSDMGARTESKVSATIKATPTKVASTSSTTKKQQKPLRVASTDEIAPEALQSESGDDPWDSASKRFDQNDPAAAVTNGVRVEDIIEASAEYKYSAARKKNPFIPALIMGRASLQKELNPNDVEIPIINPLQSFRVEQLSVIGVWEGDDSVWKALIQTPTNQGIETKLGDPAGNSGGRIMSITPEAVVVREFSVRADGTREYRDIPLYMGSDKPSVDSSNIGGRVILRPGSSTPEIEAPAGGDLKPVPSASLAPSSTSGTLKTVIPAAEVASPAAGGYSSPAGPAMNQTFDPANLPPEQTPGSATYMDGGLR